MADSANLELRVFDGTRQPVSPSLNILVTLRDGNQTQVHRDYHHGPVIPFEVPFYNNFGDDYAVIAYASKYEQAGFVPVHVSPVMTQRVEIMLLPKKKRFNFDAADWGRLKVSDSRLVKILSHGAANANAAQQRYDQLKSNKPKALAALLNITTAMGQINLSQGTPMDYFKEMIWDDTIKQDRFYAYADQELLHQVKLAVGHGEFKPEPGASIIHKGATSSYKQVQFGEANIQLSFHENDTKTIDGVDCFKIEPDMDYYKDPVAHALLEVLPNHFSDGLTNPEVIYVLRWIAGRHAGVPEFAPPYTIEAATPQLK